MGYADRNARNAVSPQREEQIEYCHFAPWDLLPFHVSSHPYLNGPIATLVALLGKGSSRLERRERQLVVCHSSR